MENEIKKSRNGGRRPGAGRKWQRLSLDKRAHIEINGDRVEVISVSKGEMQLRDTKGGIYHIKTSV